MSSYINLLPEVIVYPLRRLKYMVFQRDRYLKFNRLREGISDEGYSLKPFDDFQCIFIHIPKCAGQSVRNTLFDNLQPGHINAYSYQYIFPRSIYNRYFKFTFVRNPWDRLVSAYFFMKSGGAHKKDQNWTDQNLAMYPDFSTFVLEGLQLSRIQAWPHFRPQVDFLRGQNGKIELDFIGRFENLQEDFNHVRDHLGQRGELLFINQTKTIREHYQTYYSDELREIAADVYKEDIEAFDYRF